VSEQVVTFSPSLRLAREAALPGHAISMMRHGTAGFFRVWRSHFFDPRLPGVPDSEVRGISRSHVSNFGIERDTGKPIELAWLSFRSPHDELAAQPMRTSEPPRQGGIFRPRAPCLAGLPQLELAPNPKGTDLP
jgi:hypothetical protein